MSDQPVETHVRVEHGLIHFEEWWVRYRASLPALGFEQVGVDSARATPEVQAAIETADVVLVAPSNPVVSIGTILGVPGIRQALSSTAAPVVGVSPIIAGAALRGMAAECLTAIGVEVSADAVARHYGARATGGLLDGWLVDTVDADVVDGLAADGIRADSRPLYLTSLDESAAIARAALGLAVS